MFSKSVFVLAGLAANIALKRLVGKCVGEVNFCMLLELSSDFEDLRADVANEALILFYDAFVLAKNFVIVVHRGASGTNEDFATVIAKHGEIEEGVNVLVMACECR